MKEKNLKTEHHSFNSFKEEEEKKTEVLKCLKYGMNKDYSGRFPTVKY